MVVFLTLSRWAQYSYMLARWDSARSPWAMVLSELFIQYFPRLVEANRRGRILLDPMITLGNSFAKSRLALRIRSIISRPPPTQFLVACRCWSWGRQNILRSDNVTEDVCRNFSCNKTSRGLSKWTMNFIEARKRRIDLIVISRIIGISLFDGVAGLAEYKSQSYGASTRVWYSLCSRFTANTTWYLQLCRSADHSQV